MRLSWSSIASAGRSDFEGYRVLQRRGGGCSGHGGYRRVAETSATARTADVTPGTLCYRVAALRTSSVTGVISSAPSAPVEVGVRAPGPGQGTAGSPRIDADFVTGQGARAKPPSPPSLGKGKVDVSDGSFGERLPYGSTTVTQGVEAEAGLGDSSVEAATTRSGRRRSWPPDSSSAWPPAVAEIPLRRTGSVNPEPGHDVGCAVCGRRLVRSVSPDEVVTIAGRRLRFRRETDFVVCEGCLAPYRVRDLRAGRVVPLSDEDLLHRGEAVVEGQRPEP